MSVVRVKVVRMMTLLLLVVMLLVVLLLLLLVMVVVLLMLQVQVLCRLSFSRRRSLSCSHGCVVRVVVRCRAREQARDAPEEREGDAHHAWRKPKQICR